MKKYFMAGACLLLLANLCPAQSGQLPPVWLYQGQYLCDDAGWKLILQDDFNGETLDTNNWITFKSYDGGWWAHDHPNWNQARSAPPSWNFYIKDENVIMGGGTVKLLAKRENKIFQTTDGVDRVAYYTAASISNRYRKGDTFMHGFNNGKFVARVKMPTFKWAHSTMWLWHGTTVNEIDIAEAYGHGRHADFWGDFPRSNWSLHSWPPPGLQNTYGLVHQENGAHHYPPFSWWDWLTNNNLKIDDFHIYTCEWDTAKIRMMIDAVDVATIWKYYQIKSYKKWWHPNETFYYQVPSTCNPGDGWAYVTEGFPYNNRSNSQLRFTTAVDKKSDDLDGYDGNYDTDHPNGLLGQMEIDWVKVYQRHPEYPWKDLNAAPEFVISGPNIVCSTATYTINNPQPNGYWQVKYGLEIVSSTNSTVTVKIGSWQYSTMGKVVYRPNNPAFTEGTALAITKPVDRGPADPISVICTKTTNGIPPSGVWFNLAAKGVAYWPFSGIQLVDPQSPTIYEWSVDYGPGNAYHFNGTGQYITTPPIPCTVGDNIPVSWTVKVTNYCGTVTKTGIQSFKIKLGLFGLKMILPDTSRPDGNHDLYAEAHIPRLLPYNEAVSERFANTFLPIDADSSTISSALAKIELEELAPYLLMPDSTRRDSVGYRAAQQAPEKESALQTSIYPNPAQGRLNLLFGNTFTTDRLATIKLLDQVGRVILASTAIIDLDRVATLDISRIPAGLYQVSIRQGNTEEHRMVAIQ